MVLRRIPPEGGTTNIRGLQHCVIGDRLGEGEAALAGAPFPSVSLGTRGRTPCRFAEAFFLGFRASRFLRHSDFELRASKIVACPSSKSAIFPRTTEFTASRK